jgi:copper chaperone NosL
MGLFQASKINTMKSTLFYIVLALLFVSCAVEPKPIQFGVDACHYCKMTIVDRQHAAQFVTEKGRAYSFDAIECMLHEDAENNEQPVALYLITDFNNPGTLIDATTATYLVSPELPSPMGANLSGFASEVEAEGIQEEYSGSLFDWEAIQKELVK